MPTLLDSAGSGGGIGGSVTNVGDIACNLRFLCGWGSKFIIPTSGLRDRQLLASHPVCLGAQPLSDGFHDTWAEFTLCHM